MKVTNDQAASAFGVHWAPGESHELDDDKAAELFAIKDAGFYPDVKAFVAAAEAEAKKLADEAVAKAEKVAKAAEAKVKKALTGKAKEITEVDPEATEPEVAPSDSDETPA